MNNTINKTDMHKLFNELHEMIKELNTMMEDQQAEQKPLLVKLIENMHRKIIDKGHDILILNHDAYVNKIYTKKEYKSLEKKIKGIINTPLYL